MELNNKPFLKWLNTYSYITTYDYRTDITKVWAIINEEGETILHIKTYRPGFLIGKAGNRVKGIIDFIKKETGYSVNIEIVEEDMWMGLYD